jgi:hypothetical protein
MAGRIFVACGCEYRRTDAGIEIRERMCPNCIDAYYEESDRKTREDRDEIARRPSRYR